MDNKTKISVIIPVYNLQNYIGRCLETVQNQTYNNLEIIVVDDGSSDDSRKIIEKFAAHDTRIVTMFQSNSGVTTARLEGIKRATGEWIGFVDGDDEIETDMYEMLLANAIKYKADISHCGYQMIFPDGRVHYFHNTNCIYVQDKKRGLQDLLDGSLVEPGLWNKLFRKELFDSLIQNNLMDCSIKINEDLLMNFFLFRDATKSVFEDKCKYHYIVRSSSVSRQKINKHKIFDPIRVKEIILRESEGEMEKDAKKAYMKTCIVTYNTLILEKQSNNQKKQIREMLKNCREDMRLLGYKYRIIFLMIIKFSQIYEKIYNLYAKCLMRSKYE